MKKKLLMIITLVLGLVINNMHKVSAYATVATGDDTSMTPYIVLLGVAVVAIILLFVLKKKKK